MSARRFLLAAAVTFLSAFLRAQSDASLKLDDLRAPSSPAFSILGVEPTEISRPTSWKSLQTTLSNSFFQDNKLVIPKNLALEFNPFFAGMPDDSGYDVYKTFMLDSTKNNAFRNHFNISLATGTFNSYADTSLQNQRMGLGVRTQLVEMKPTRKAKNLFTSFLQLQSQITFMNVVIMGTQAQLSLLGQDTTRGHNKKTAAFSIESTLTNKVKGFNNAALNTFFITTVLPELARIEAQTPKSSSDTASWIQRDSLVIVQLNNFINNLDEQDNFRSSVKNVREAVNDKFGWSVEVATALLLDFPTNDLAFSMAPKGGLWTTVTYRTENQHFEFGGLARYQYSRFDKKNPINNIDFGGRIMFEAEDWSLNGELIQRFQWQVLSYSNTTGQNVASVVYSNDFKASLTVAYRVNDNFILNYTFGNNFSVNTETPTSSNLISSVGVVYALGGPQIKTNKN